MKYSDEYTIQFKGLKEGTHEFNFNVNNKFFEHFDNSEVKKGELKIQVILIKTLHLLTLNIHISGKVNMICDRCLDPFDLPVEYNTVLYVKIDATENLNNEEIIVLSPDEHQINLTQYIYEYIHLSLPLKRVHPNDQEGKSTCNKDMLSQLKKFSAYKNKAETDPRWEVLTKISKTEKN